MLPVLALRARDLGADVSVAAAIVALLGVGQLLASLPAGALVARIGERRALVGAGLVDACAMTFAALTDSVLGLATGVLLSGVCWTLFLIARQGFMIDVVPESHRARAMSLLGGSYRVGVLIGPLIGAGLIAVSDLTSVFWLGASMSVLASLLAATMPDLGEEKRAAALDVAFKCPGGWLMDTRGRMVVAVPVVLSMAVACLLLPLATDAVSVALVMALIACGNGLGSGIVMTLGADAAPADGRSQFLGAWRLCGDIGNTGGPLLVGALAAVAPLGVACVTVGLLALAGAGWVGLWTRRVDLDRAALSRR